MAYGETFTPRGGTGDIKVRGPVWVGVFSLVTLGIYAIYWIYVTAKDLSEYGKVKGRDLGQSPGMTLLAVTLGAFIIVPPFVAWSSFMGRIREAQRMAGLPQTANFWGSIGRAILILYNVKWHQEQFNEIGTRPPQY